MADRVIGIDLEWRPEYTRGVQNRVALMQLASSTCAILLRTCRMDVLPACLRSFLRYAESPMRAASLSALGFHRSGKMTY